MSIPDENSQKLLIIIFKSKKALICILNFSKIPHQTVQSNKTSHNQTKQSIFL